MSLPDYLLDTEEVFCEMCGLIPREYGRTCWECRKDLDDLCADEAIQDAFNKEKS